MVSAIKNQTISGATGGFSSFEKKGESLSEPLPEPGRAAYLPEFTDGEGTSGEDWEAAQERVLLYLKFLNIPSTERLELALEALRRARLDETSDLAIPAVMRAVRALIQQRHRAGLQSQPASSVPVNTRWKDLQSVPMLNRGSMTHVEFDRTTVLTISVYLLRLLLKVMGLPLRLLFKPGFLFFILFMLLSLFWAFEVH